MRTSFFVMFAMLAAFGLNGCRCGDSGACDDSHPGELNGCCPTDGCHAGLTCVETSCQPCGGTGEHCCYAPMALNGTCDSGLTCASPDMGGETCQACGMLGGACCEGSSSPPCGTGAACVSGTCQTASALCPAGSARFAVGISDVNGCGLRVISIDTDSFEHAVQCAGTMLGAGEHVYSDAPGTLQDYTLCVHTRMEGDRDSSVRAFNDYDARTCACMGTILGCTVDYHTCT